jgi:hypothetical protein
MLGNHADASLDENRPEVTALGGAKPVRRLLHANRISNEGWGPRHSRLGLMEEDHAAGF